MQNYTQKICKTARPRKVNSVIVRDHCTTLSFTSSNFERSGLGPCRTRTGESESAVLRVCRHRLLLLLAKSSDLFRHELFSGNLALWLKNSIHLHPIRKLESQWEQDKEIKRVGINIDHSELFFSVKKTGLTCSSQWKRVIRLNLHRLSEQFV